MRSALATAAERRVVCDSFAVEAAHDVDAVPLATEFQLRMAQSSARAARLSSRAIAGSLAGSHVLCDMG